MLVHSCLASDVLKMAYVRIKDDEKCPHTSFNDMVQAYFLDIVSPSQLNWS